MANEQPGCTQRQRRFQNCPTKHSRWQHQQQLTGGQTMGMEPASELSISLGVTDRSPVTAEAFCPDLQEFLQQHNILSEVTATWSPEHKDTTGVRTTSQFQPWPPPVYPGSAQGTPHLHTFHNATYIRLSMMSSIERELTF